jgi:linoleoyl-CoA desaturase
METIVKFKSSAPFRAELKKRIDLYYSESKASRRDTFSLYAKAVFMLLWMGASYYALVFLANSWIEGILASLSLGLALTGIGFNIQHDGSHNGFSKWPWMNRIAGSTSDYFLGASSFLWKQKHNVRHHAFTNIPDIDQDINFAFLGRVSFHHKLLPFHRFQHFYLWGLYGLVHLRYLYGDFQTIYKGQINNSKIPRLKGVELFNFVFGKIVFFGFALLVPLILHPFWQVLIGYILVSFTISIIFILVAQLAHTVGEAQHPEFSPAVDSEWAVHQIKTTAGFAHGNRILTWYVGGLNYQVEHHLFTDIAHTHYPAMAKIVKDLSREFGLHYNENPSLFSALRSHYFFLKKMGQPGSVR